MIAWTERSRSSEIGAHDAVEYAKNDHMKGSEHAMEAQKHSKVASGATEAAHSKSSSQK